MHEKENEADEVHKPDAKNIDLSLLDSHLFNKCYSMKTHTDRAL